MKAYQRYILFFLMLFALHANAQLLIKPNKAHITPGIEAVLKTRKAVVQYEAIQIDRAKLSDSMVQLQFLNEPLITLKKRRVDERGSRSFSWFGKNADNSASIILTVLDDDIMGIVTRSTAVYRIETIQGIYVVTKLDHSLYPSESCSHGLDKGNNSGGSIPKSIRPIDETLGASKRSSYPLQTEGNFQCKLRILVMYTPAAGSKVGNILNAAQLCIDEFNQALYNSNVNYEVEMAGLRTTGYTESGDIHDDVDNFAASGDGYLDEVFELRERFAADICVLLEETPSECGTSKAIKSCFESAFCVVDVDCSTGHYSFAHEVAHLLGCRHNIQADENETPYYYGHGYRFENFAHNDSSYRTIMSYDCELGCNRLQYFSNPNIFFQGRPLGSAVFGRNYQVLNNNIPHYMAYRPITPKRVIDQTDIGDPSDFIYNHNKIETNGSVSIASSQYYYFAAGIDIELLPGFEANEGNTFVAEIVNTSCGLPALTDSCDYYSDNDTLSDLDDLLTKRRLEDFLIYPNPTNDFFSVISKLELVNVNIALKNYLGQTITIIHETKVKAMSDFRFDISSQASGIYFVVVNTGNTNIFVYKIIKQ